MTLSRSCPECDSTDIIVIIRKELTEGDEDFRCDKCNFKFDTPNERELSERHRTIGNLSEAGKALLEADPDEFGRRAD